MEKCFYNYIIVLSTLVMCFNINLNAQSSEENHNDSLESHNEYHSHVAIFLGSTTFYNNGENYFSVGADYVYRPNPEKPWAFSIIGEVIFAEHTEFVIALPVYYHLISHWWMRAGPGMEIIQEEEHHGHEVETKTHIEFLFRIGTGYAFHVGRIVLTPSVDIDFVRNNDALVWGLNIGYSF